MSYTKIFWMFFGFGTNRNIAMNTLRHLSRAFAALRDFQKAMAAFNTLLALLNRGGIELESQ
jgi:hypothetical protein